MRAVRGKMLKADPVRLAGGPFIANGPSHVELSWYGPGKRMTESLIGSAGR